jgi:hypothetical protein
MSHRRLVIVHPEGLLGDVILAALGDCDGIRMVDDIVDLGGSDICEECVCIVFGSTDSCEEIGQRLGDKIEPESLVIIVDHHDPFITLFRLSAPCVERRRMGMAQFIVQVHAALDGDHQWEPSSPFIPSKL